MRNAQRAVIGFIVLVVTFATPVQPLGVAHADAYTMTVFAPVDQATVVAGPVPSFSKGGFGSFQFDLAPVGGGALPVRAAVGVSQFVAPTDPQPFAVDLVVGDVLDPCGGTPYAHTAGMNVLLTVLMNGVRVGVLEYTNLIGIPPTGTVIRDGDQVGTMISTATGATVSPCWKSPHVTVAAAASYATTCFVDRPVGSMADSGTALGMMGVWFPGQPDDQCPEGSLLNHHFADRTVLRVDGTAEHYVAAGGAALPVSDPTWLNTTNEVVLTRRQLGCMLTRVGFGTLLRGHIRHETYVVVGGAAIRYPDNRTDPYHPIVMVDDAVIDQAGTPGVGSHLAAIPKDNTILQAATSGIRYVVAGGAPVQAGGSFTGGDDAVVADTAIANAGTGGNWNHLRAYPTNGVLLIGHSNRKTFITAGGAPIRLSNGILVGTHTAIDVHDSTIWYAGTAGSHLRAYPANGTHLRTWPEGISYDVIYGVPRVASPAANAVVVDSLAIANAGQPLDWKFLKSLPAGAVVSTAIPSHNSVVLRWAVPAGGGWPIQDYRAQYRLNGTTTWHDFTDPVSASPSITVTGLANARAYTFRVASKTVAGWGPFGRVSAAAVPGIPLSPQPPGLQPPGVGFLHVVWNTRSDGGYAITDYLVQISSDNGVTWRTVRDGVSPLNYTTVEGLRSGATYVFRVAARNRIGTSPWTAKSVPMVPY